MFQKKTKKVRVKKDRSRDTVEEKPRSRVKTRKIENEEPIKPNLVTWTKQGERLNIKEKGVLILKGFLLAEKSENNIVPYFLNKPDINNIERINSMIRTMIESNEIL